MTEFTAKKLGEVLAFSRVGLELFERGRAALEQAFAPAYCEQATRMFGELAAQIERFIKGSQSREIALTKAEATTNKLRGMMETYIGEEWENPVELLEWLGFFSGAGIVHWMLVAGAAETLADSTLTQVVADGCQGHEELLAKTKAAIARIGRDKAGI